MCWRARARSDVDVVGADSACGVRDAGWNARLRPAQFGDALPDGAARHQIAAAAPGVRTRTRQSVDVAATKRLRRSSPPNVKFAAGVGTCSTPRQCAFALNTWIPPGPVH